MGTKLYVANLPEAASVLALRAHFSACGVVSDVQIVPERHAGRGRGSAFVRMSNPAGAERARAVLNGAPFGGQLLLVEAAPDEVGDRRDRATRRTHQHDDDTRTRITTQFREPANMVCELDCAGITVFVRIYFPDTAGQWRVKVQASRESDAPSSVAAAPSRIEAFRGVAAACREGASLAALGSIDWDSIETAMLKVRAL